MTFEDFASRFEKKRKTTQGFMVRCLSHEDRTESLSISRGDDGRVLLKCFAGCSVDQICGAFGLTIKDLFAQEPAKPFKPIEAVASSAKNGDVKPIIEKIYSYTDVIGTELYQAIRMKPKTFRQRHFQNGSWVWNMDGVERVLYHLPEVSDASRVWLTEGEKDADNLTELGFVATCNVGGAGKWLDGYTEFLAGKEIVICGDTDEPGKKHVTLVFESIAKKTKSVRIIRLPSDIKDVSDYIDTFKTKDEARIAVTALMDLSVPHIGGVRMPIYTMAEIEPKYRAQVRNTETMRLDLGDWIPSFRGRVRPLIPGELAFILGGTGVGKTCLLQNIANAARSLNTLMFELELPEELLFERNVALKMNMPCAAVEEDYRSPTGGMGEAALAYEFPNLYICPEPRLTLGELEMLICKSELKIGSKPNLVLLDYVQLLQGEGSRYEKTSNIAEGLKVMAKATQTIVVVASQISRPKEDDPEVSLNAGKDSGSIENSGGLVIGAWRDAEDRSALILRVLKSSKGGSGFQVTCNFNGETMTITERARVSDDDIPENTQGRLV